MIEFKKEDTMTTQDMRVASPVDAGQREDKRWWALAVLMLPVLLVSVDNTVLAFAVPKISAALQPTGNQLLWLVDIYPLVLAGLLVPMGSMGDRFGRRKALLIGGTGFTIFSLAAAFMPDPSLVVFARAAMGFFGAMIMPATLSLIRNIFEDAKERRLAIAIWAAAFSGGSAIGPILGGFLLEHFYWGSVFIMAVPFLLPMLILAPILVPESRDPQPGPIDPVAIVLVMLTMTPLVYGIKHTATAGFDGASVTTFAVAIVAGWLFVRRMLRKTTPMLDVRLFARPDFTGAIMANLLSFFSLVGFLYFISQHFQLVSGYGPMMAGLMLLPGTVVTMAAGLVAVKLVQRFAPRTVVTGGLLFNAVGYAVVMWAGSQGSDLGLVLAFVLVGAGVGMAETIANDLVISAVPPHKAGAASAISETAYETGAVLGTAILGSILNAAYRAHLVIPDEAATPAREASDGTNLLQAAGETLGGAVRAGEQIGGAVGSELITNAQHAFDSGVLITSAIAIVLMLFAAVLSWRTLRHAETD